MKRKLKLNNTMKGFKQYEAIVNKISTDNEIYDVLEVYMQWAKPEIGLFVEKRMVKLPVRRIDPFDEDYDEVGADWWVKWFEHRHSFMNWYIHAEELIQVLGDNEPLDPLSYISENFCDLSKFISYVHELDDWHNSSLTKKVTRYVQLRDRFDVRGEVVMEDAHGWGSESTDLIRELVSDLLVFYIVNRASIVELDAALDTLAVEITEHLTQLDDDTILLFFLARLIVNTMSSWIV